MGSGAEDFPGFLPVWVQSSRFSRKKEDESNFGNVGLSARGSLSMSADLGAVIWSWESSL